MAMTGHLVEGKKYGLSSQDSSTSLTNHHHKSVIYVKLTDSALRAIEHFQKQKKSSKENATIKFIGSQGEICVPGSNEAETRCFQFSMSSLQNESKSSFECIAHCNDHMSNVGLIGNKLTILANDDVYQTTREKFSLVEEESKKNCAKEIKPNNGGVIGRVIKKAIRPNGLPTSLPKNSTNSSEFPTSAHRVTSAQNSRTLSSAFTHRSLNESSLQHSSSSSLSSPSVVQGRKISAASQLSTVSPTVESRKSLAMAQLCATVSPTVESRPPPKGSDPTKPSLGGTDSKLKESGLRQSTGGSGVQSSLKPLGNSSAINFPYRDRVIHLLALRPYTKPELLVRLQKDGIREKDKNCLSTTLQGVAQLNPRDNSYSLARHLWATVRIDWPFYTEENRAEVNQRKTRCMESVSPVSECSSISPLHSAGSQSCSPVSLSQQKRPADPEPTYSEPSNKKARIAHATARAFASAHAPGTTASVTKPTSPALTVVQSSSSVSSLVNGQSGQQPAGPFSAFTCMRRSQPSGMCNGTSEVPNNLLDSPNDSRENRLTQSQLGDDNENSEDDDDDDDNNDTADYIEKYPVVTNDAQRRRFKEDFYLEYDEYLELRAELTKHTIVFRELEQELKKTGASSTQYESIRKRVIDKYTSLHNDAKYPQQRRRCDYLSKKLGHIKQRVEAYDAHRAMKSGLS
jgi:RNA polymerase II elongation factor ELL